MSYWSFTPSCTLVYTELAQTTPEPPTGERPHGGERALYGVKGLHVESKAYMCKV